MTTNGQCTPYSTNWSEPGYHTTPEKEFASCARHDNEANCQASPYPHPCWWDTNYPYGCCKALFNAPPTADCHLGRTDCLNNYNNCFWAQERLCGNKSCATKCTPEQCREARCEQSTPYACLDANNDQIGCKANSEGWDVPGPNPCTSCCDVRSCEQN